MCVEHKLHDIGCHLSRRGAAAGVGGDRLLEKADLTFASLPYRIMHEFQIGKEINDVEVEKIVVFLRTLNGEYNGKMLQ